MYREPNALTDVAIFMKAFTQPVLDVPTIPSDDRCELRVKLIQEELNELSDAIKNKDIVLVADALCDLQYVLSGAVHEFGLGERFAGLFDDVHSSNMSKICSSYEEATETLKDYTSKGIEVYSERLEGDTYIIKRKEDNKVLKNLYYTPASLEKLVNGDNPKVALMPPFMRRLLFEESELKEKTNKLSDYINNGMPNADAFNKELLPIQKQAMETYLVALQARIKSLQG